MKHLVLEVSTNERISNLTWSSVSNYAQRINADYVRIHGDEWNKTQVKDFFRTYQRILLVHSQTLIREDCPDLFQIVPREKIGVFNEGKYVGKFDFKNILDQKNGDSWNGEYYDSGVVVASKIHKELFEVHDVHDQALSFEDQFNLNIYLKKPLIHELAYKFNHMHYVDEIHGMPRHSSYVMQYKHAPEEIALTVIQKDIETWNSSAPEFDFKRMFVVSVSAGMGDQLCAEPAIRYMQKLYPESEFIVVTHFPRLFQHLDCQVCDHDEWTGIDRTVMVTHTCPDDTQAKHHFSHVLFHPTDFASMSMYRMTIPHHEKTIRLEVKDQDLEGIEHALNSVPEDRPLVLVHPGKWWESKTFPVEWWQEVIDGLAQNFTVGLIGKTLSEEQGYLPVECPESGIDFRDSTTLGELVALISKAPLLITNDSSPLHIAGAFDNWVMVIPTAKHPDHILPFRNGTQYYKTKALYKKILMQDLELRATEIDLDTINIVPRGKSFNEYLPDPETVIREALSVFSSENAQVLQNQKDLCV